MIKFEGSVMVTDESIQLTPSIATCLRADLRNNLIRSIWYDSRVNMPKTAIEMLVEKGAQFRTVWYPKSKMWRLNVQIFVPEEVSLFEKPKKKSEKDDFPLAG